MVGDGKARSLLLCSALESNAPLCYYCLFVVVLSVNKKRKFVACILHKLYAFRILIPNLKTINLTFGGLSPILYVKEDLNFGRFFRFYFVMELNKIVLLPIPTGWGDSNRPMGDGLWLLNGFLQNLITLL